MPTCQPEDPQFATGSERLVWAKLRDQLRPDDLLLSNLRISDHAKDHELDVVVALPGAGVVVVEVKGGSVWHDGTGWRQDRSSTSTRTIRPVDQARDGKFALRTLVENDPRWRGRSRIRWAHAVCLPSTQLPDGFFTPDLDRWAVVDRTQLDDLAGSLWDIPAQQESGCRPPDAGDVTLIAEILRGRGLPQRDVVAIALDREATADQLTMQQATILGAIQLLHRVEVRGGAGSGKTFLAVEQARRLSAAGERVALLCYSRGLAAYLERHVAQWRRQHRPAYVGTFHGLGERWGAEPGPDVPQYWEIDLPARMAGLAEALPPGQRFDAVVVDEAQDFAESWWPPLLASLKDPDTGGVYVFSDEGQRVFARYGEPPVPLVPLLLDHNLRNTRQIADGFHPLAPTKMRLLGGDGDAVRIVRTTKDEAVHAADDVVDELLDAGWRHEDIALLTIGSRHPQQTALQADGQDRYWTSFWDTDEVFYGHVLGFKGLERRVVVLAVNCEADIDRAREKLYVGLSRARDLLVVCGDPAVIRAIGGEDVAKRLGLSAR